MMDKLVFGLCLVVLFANSQLREYDCVAGNFDLCDDIPEYEGIDPRILPPDNEEISYCPEGFDPCFHAKCGITTVNQRGNFGPADRGTYPWQAYLTDGYGGYIGSGVILDSYHVLTAAHKISNISSVNVIAGLQNSDDFSEAQATPVRRIAIHSNYNVNTLREDVAVLQLEDPLNFTRFITPACLPSSDQSFVNDNCEVSGWGQTAFNVDDAPTRYKKFVKLTIVSGETCRRSFANILQENVTLYLDTNKQLCAGGEANRDACTQDGGAPLVCSVNGIYYTAGLVLWGKNCGRQNVYGVYLNVAAYNSWIECSIRCLNVGGSCNSCPAVLR